MHRSRLTFSRFAALAMIALSAAASWPYALATRVSTAAQSLATAVTGWVIKIAQSMPTAPKAGTQPEADRERTPLIAAKAYLKRILAKRSPTIEPGWRMCAST